MAETITTPLPCPFCGTVNGEHVGLIVIQSHETKTPAYAVKCLGCGAWGPYGASNKGLAIELWNRRESNGAKIRSEQPSKGKPTVEVNLHETFDASVWVEEWFKAIEKNPNLPNDKGATIGWFANAIMAGYDHAYRASVESSNTIMLGMSQVGSYALSKHQGDIFVLAASSFLHNIADVFKRNK